MLGITARNLCQAFFKRNALIYMIFHNHLYLLNFYLVRHENPCHFSGAGSLMAARHYFANGVTVTRVRTKMEWEHIAKMGCRSGV